MTFPIIHTVIVNWNQPKFTLRCIESLKRQKDVECRIVVVDNGSTDTSLIEFQCLPTDIKIIQNPVNLGFAGGYNRGIKYCIEDHAQYVLILNNDTFAHPHMVFHLLQAFQEGIAAVSPIIYYASEPQKIWSQGGRINWFLSELRDNHGRNNPKPTNIEGRDFLSGCCLLLLTKAIQNVGFLDENFFLYYEDLDWSIRFHKCGWRLLLQPRAKLWHSVSVSSEGTDTPQERYWMARSSVYYYRKQCKGRKLLILVFWRFLSAIKTSIHLLMNGKGKALLAYYKGLWDGLRDIRR